MPAHRSGWEPGVNGSLSDALLLPVFFSFPSIPWRLRVYVNGVCICLFVCLCVGFILHVKCFGGREISRIVSGPSQHPQFLAVDFASLSLPGWPDSKSELSIFPALA